MIGSLRGKLTFKQAPQIIIECQGVGYEVETPMSTFLELPSVGDDLFLFAHLLVREDAQTLYGFSTEDERHLFRTLLRISGVGAKMGLAILSTMSVSDFQRCVKYEDAAGQDPRCRQKDSRTPDHRIT
jgi:Holliday junction DNA helicase RuvA